MISVLFPVDWWVDIEESGEPNPYYRACDLCYQSATDDALEGRKLKDFRAFWKQHGGNDDGLTVCEKCIDEFLSEKP